MEVLPLTLSYYTIWWSAYEYFQQRIFMLLRLEPATLVKNRNMCKLMVSTNKWLVYFTWKWLGNNQLLITIKTVG